MNCDNKGRTMQLYFIDGRPDGMLTAEVFNWTGHVLMTPRTKIGTALKREEASRTGIYILLGAQTGETQAYIGRAEIICRRVSYQLRQKDWVETVVLVTSANNNLNAAHVTYLEARLIEEARAVGFPLDNTDNPARPGLSEADRANMEMFLDYLLMILPAVHVDMFPSRRCLDDCSSAVSVQENGPQNDGPVVFELIARQLGIQATAIQDENGDFVVQKGSKARSQWVGSPLHTYAREHVKLSQKVLRPDPDGNTLLFTRNYPFTSPSTAASVIRGTPANGRTAWTVQGSGDTYGEWEAKRLGDPPEGE